MEESKFIESKNGNLYEKNLHQSTINNLTDFQIDFNSTKLSVNMNDM